MAIRESAGTPLSKKETEGLLFDRISERCRIFARKAIRSTTLKNALRRVLPPGEGDVKPGLFLEPYWAAPYHDGHKAIRALQARKIVFFGDIRKDPRQGFGKSYPVRESDRVRFSQAEFYDQLRRNRLRSNPRNVMQVKNVAGPSKPNPFFEEGMTGVSEDIDVRGNLIPALNRHITIGLLQGSENLTVSL